MCKKCLKMRLIFGAVGFFVGAAATGIAAYIIYDKKNNKAVNEKFAENDQKKIAPTDHKFFITQNPPLQSFVKYAESSHEEHCIEDGYRPVAESDEEEEENMEVDLGHNAELEPYIITESAFLYDDSFNKDHLTFFREDGILCDDHSNLVEPEVVGAQIMDFLANSDEDTWFIRNEKLDLDIEISVNDGAFYNPVDVDEDEYDDYLSRIEEVGGFEKIPKRKNKKVTHEEDG